MPKAAETIKKITMAKVLGELAVGGIDIEAIKLKDKKSVMLVRVIGVATRFKPGTSDKGDFCRFYGQFKATNLITGEIYESAQGIFPQLVEQSLFGVMGNDGKEVQMAFDMGVKYSPTAITKYEYIAQPLLPPAENNPIALLEKQITAALPAPTAKPK